MKTCEVCKQNIKFSKGKITLEDYSRGQFIACNDCYKKMPKEKKKQLTYINGKLNVGTTLTGFAIGGIIGGIAYGSAYKDGYNSAIKHSQKKYGYTDKQMNDFSIDIFDMHFGLLDDNRQRAVLDKFEGKTDSRYYIKYIHFKVP